MRRIADDLGRAVGRRDLELHVLAEAAAQERLHARDDRIEVDDARLGAIPLRERQELTNQGRAANRRFLDLVRVLAWSAIRDVIHQQLGRREDRRQQIVEVVGNATRELTHGLEPLRAAERLFEPRFASLVVDLIVDVGDRAQEPRGLIGVSDVERRKAEADVTIRAVSVIQPQGGLADLLRFEITHACPVRIGLVPIVDVDEGVQTVGSGHVLERRAEEIASVQHLTTSVAAVEQDDDVGRAPQDRSEPLLRRAQLGLDDELLLERLVEETVLVAEMPDRVITAREHEAGGQRERGQGAAHEKHEIGERDPQQAGRRARGADEKSETAPTERHRLIPRDETGDRSGTAEHDPSVRARGHQREPSTGGRRQRDLEIDRRVSARWRRWRRTRDRRSCGLAGMSGASSSRASRARRARRRPGDGYHRPRATTRGAPACLVTSAMPARESVELASTSRPSTAANRCGSRPLVATTPFAVARI